MSTGFDDDDAGLSADALERLSALADGEIDAGAARHACGHWRDARDARRRWHAYHLIGDVLRSEDLACTSARETAFLAALRVRLQDEPVVLAPQPLGASVALGAPASHERDAVGLHAIAPVRARSRAWAAPAALAAGVVVLAGGWLAVNGGPGLPGGARTAFDARLLSAATSRSETVTTGAAGATREAAATARPAIGTLEPGATSTPAATVTAAATSTAALTATSTAAATGPRPDAAPAAADPATVVAADGRLIRSARLDQYLTAHKQFAGSSALGLPSGFLRNATATEADR